MSDKNAKNFNQNEDSEIFNVSLWLELCTLVSCSEVIIERQHQLRKEDFFESNPFVLRFIKTKIIQFAGCCVMVYRSYHTLAYPTIKNLLEHPVSRVSVFFICLNFIIIVWKARFIHQFQTNLKDRDSLYSRNIRFNLLVIVIKFGVAFQGFSS